MKVSIKTISEKTGFSPATVSNALNYKRGVNAETSAKIFKIAQELGYFEENRIRKVKFVIFKKDGSIVEDTPFFVQMISGAEKECRACGMEMQLCNLDKRDPDYADEAKWLTADKTSAVILLANEMTEEDTDLITRITCPLVVIDYWQEDMRFNAVLANNADSARMATEYLIANGHTEIGYLRGDFRIKPFRSRRAGYQIALQKAGIPLQKEYTVTLPTTIDGAYESMKKHLKQSQKLPTAFFAENDMIALGAMKALTEAGFRVPEDISVVGFDDIPYSSVSDPPLTTIRVPKQEIGRTAVRRLRQMIEDGDDLRLKIQVCTEFIVRDSVRKRS